MTQNIFLPLSKVLWLINSCYTIFKYETKKNTTLLLIELYAVMWVPCIWRHPLYEKILLYIDVYKKIYLKYNMLKNEIMLILEEGLLVLTRIPIYPTWDVNPWYRGMVQIRNNEWISFRQVSNSSLLLLRGSLIKFNNCSNKLNHE